MVAETMLDGEKQAAWDVYRSSSDLFLSAKGGLA
jgi:hypothetical protein